MRATAVLLAWCAGLGAGYLGLLTPSREFAVVAAAFIAMAAGLWLISRPGARTPAAAENQAPPMPVVWAAVILLSGAALLLGLVRGEAGRAPSGPGSVQAYLGQTVALNGRVEAAALPAGGAGANPAAAAQSFHLATVEVDAGGHRVAAAGAVLVQARGHAQVFDGQRVSVRGKLVRLRQVAPGGLTGYADRLERQGVIAELSATSLTALDPPTVFSPGRAAAAVRAGIVTAIRGALPEPEATVVLGEVAGIRGAVPANVDSDLVQSGLVHILAISGIKVAIVAGLLQALTLPLFGRRGALLAIAGLGLYTVVGGATASALRSALMGSLGLVGAVIRRDTDVIRSLLLVGSVMLGHRPALIADLSFQYSFLGVLGIHLFAESLAQRVRIVPQPFREALAVTLAAQLATLPLTAHYFAVVPLLSPLANGLVLPGLPVAIVGGLAISALHAATELLPVALWAQVLGSATVPLAALVFLLTRAALAVAHLVRVIPGAAIAAPGFGAPATAAYYAAGAVVVAGQARRWPRLRMAALAAGLALAALLVLGHPDGRLHLVFASGVTGPVAVLVAPDGATMLLGAGSSAAALGPALGAELPVAAPLPGMPRRLDAVVLT
ncbi:MAG: ComEC/Rec2 family competence protein, partial [Candidatus Dormiibacterota bacterium]